MSFLIVSLFYLFLAMCFGGLLLAIHHHDKKGKRPTRLYQGDL